MGVATDYYVSELTRKLDTARHRYEAWADEKGLGEKDRETGNFRHYDLEKIAGNILDLDAEEVLENE